MLTPINSSHVLCPSRRPVTMQEEPAGTPATEDAPTVAETVAEADT